MGKHSQEPEETHHDVEVGFTQNESALIACRCGWELEYPTGSVRVMEAYRDAMKHVRQSK